MSSDPVLWFHSIDLDDPALDFALTSLVPGVYVALLSSLETTDAGIKYTELPAKMTDPATGSRVTTGYQRQRYEPGDPSGQIDWGKPVVNLPTAVGVAIFSSFNAPDPLWATLFPGGETMTMPRGLIATVRYSNLRQFVEKSQEGAKLDVKLSRERR